MQQKVVQETALIADEIVRASQGEAWHGLSIGEALATVDSETAAGRPIHGAHTIWEIVLHMTAWAKEVERRLRERAHPLVGEQDWPPVTATTSDAWASAKRSLMDVHAQLRQTIRDFSDVRLGQTVPFNGGTSASNARESVRPVEQGSFYVMLHGLAQHDAYHTGQIAMLRKAQRKL